MKKNGKKNAQCGLSVLLIYFRSLCNQNDPSLNFTIIKIKKKSQQIARSPYQCSQNQSILQKFRSSLILTAISAKRKPFHFILCTLASSPSNRKLITKKKNVPYVKKITHNNILHVREIDLMKKIIKEKLQRLKRIPYLIWSETHWPKWDLIVCDTTESVCIQLLLSFVFRLIFFEFKQSREIFSQSAWLITTRTFSQSLEYFHCSVPEL